MKVHLTIVLIASVVFVTGCDFTLVKYKSDPVLSGELICEDISAVEYFGKISSADLVFKGSSHTTKWSGGKAISLENASVSYYFSNAFSDDCIHFFMNPGRFTGGGNKEKYVQKLEGDLSIIFDDLDFKYTLEK